MSIETVFQKLDAAGNRIGAAICRIDAALGIAPEYNMRQAERLEAAASRYDDRPTAGSAALNQQTSGERSITHAHDRNGHNVVVKEHVHQVTTVNRWTEANGYVHHERTTVTRK